VARGAAGKRSSIVAEPGKSLDRGVRPIGALAERTASNWCRCIICGDRVDIGIFNALGNRRHLGMGARTAPEIEELLRDGDGILPSKDRYFGPHRSDWRPHRIAMTASTALRDARSTFRLSVSGPR